jgi:mitofilin
MEELEKVKALLNKESDKALTEAHSELAKLSILNLDNLDDMTLTQLKVRIVQMAKEMEDRTKWEAVRLQEFLTMKEKEVEDKYVRRL